MYLALSLPVKQRSVVSTSPPNLIGRTQKPLPMIVRRVTRT